MPPDVIGLQFNPQAQMQRKAWSQKMTKLFELIAIPFGYVMKFSYMLTHNYLLAILLFTLVMEIILSPIAIKQQKNQIKQHIDKRSRRLL